VRPNVHRLRILGIGGSLRPQSLTYVALEYAISIARHLGCQTSIFDLRRHTLPFCNGDKKDPRLDHPTVGQLRCEVSRAHALILATPEYHGSVSGVLKNALDLLDFDHMEAKVVGGISVLGGRSNSNALNDLRQIVRWCHAWAIPEQIAIGQARSVITDGQLHDPELAERFEIFVTSLVHNTLRLNDYFLPELRNGHAVRDSGWIIEHERQSAVSRQVLDDG
jgi:FMN reductase